MKETNKGSQPIHSKYVIVGAGPAGLQLAYYLKKQGRDYRILESGDCAGTFFKSQPRHGKLISANKIYTGYDDPVRNLRWDWNSLISDDDNLLFKKYSEEYFPPSSAMVDYLGDYAKNNDLEIDYGVRISAISRNENFLLKSDDGREFSADVLVMATGVSKPYIPDIPGVELMEQYCDVDVDPASFKNQKVLVVGKGNSAFETADNLLATTSRLYVCSPTPITLSWKSKFVGHLRAVNNGFVDTYQLKLQNVMLDAKLVAVERVPEGLQTTFHYAHADDEVETMVFDRVICCTGFRFDSSMFDENCKPELTINDRFPSQSPAFESTNVPGLFFAGTIMQALDHKKKQSGFIHGFRHNIVSLANILEERFEGMPWPRRKVAESPSAMAASILARANRAPGLWQQTGFLCDVIVRDESAGELHYFEDVPTEYAHSSKFADSKEMYVMTLEFGLDIIYASPDPLAVERIHKDDFQNAHLSTGIHPIIRRYDSGKLVGEHHVVEDIIPEWDDQEIHFKPLEQFFQHLSAMEEKPLELA